MSLDFLKSPVFMRVCAGCTNGNEATAFTDPENENKIQRSIMALSKGKTLLVIAHRLSTIQNADQIVVLEKGQIVDRGTQSELLSRCPPDVVGSPYGGANLGGHFRGKGGELRCFIVSDAFCGGRRAIGSG